MLDQKRIKEAENNTQRYIQEGLLFTKHASITQYSRFFLNNAETSLITAKILYELSTDPQKQDLLALQKPFESYLWVIVSSYYSMFYASLALLAKHNIKTGDKIVHKVVMDALVAKFLNNQKLAKLIEDYEETKNDALEIVGSEEKAFELVQSFEYERKKRHKLQYELGSEAKQNLAKTSLTRASNFVAEIRNILRIGSQ